MSGDAGNFQTLRKGFNMQNRLSNAYTPTFVVSPLLLLLRTPGALSFLS
jgi:hypothetical protein